MHELNTSFYITSVSFHVRTSFLLKRESSAKLTSSLNRNKCLNVQYVNIKLEIYTKKTYPNVTFPWIVAERRQSIQTKFIFHVYLRINSCDYRRSQFVPNFKYLFRLQRFKSIGNNYFHYKCRSVGVSKNILLYPQYCNTEEIVAFVKPGFVSTQKRKAVGISQVYIKFLENCLWMVSIYCCFNFNYMGHYSIVKKLNRSEAAPFFRMVSLR